LLGAFTIGYVQGIQVTVPRINSEIYYLAGSLANLAPSITTRFTSYIEQNVTPTLGSYLVVGILLAVGGLILIARGDRKPKSIDKGEPILTASPLAKQQD
jgi:hypothetical protein